MPWPTTFANLAAGNQPLALFDAMFNQVANMVAIPTLATGTNALTLQPIGNAPSLSGYQNFNSFRFTAPATSTGPLTAQYQANGFLPVFLNDGVTQAGSGVIVNTQEYLLVFIQALNSGGGGFVLESAGVSPASNQAGSTIFGLYTVNNFGGNPNTQVTGQWQEIVMNNPTGLAIRFGPTGPITCDASTNGVNGLDTGALAANTWYALWAISNGATPALLLSLSYSNPAMPVGYTYKKYIASKRTDGAAHFLRVSQLQRRAQYMTISAPLPSMAVGVNGNLSTPVWFTLATGGFIPPTAISIQGTALLSTAGVIAGMMMAPSNSYGPYNSTGNSPPFVMAIATGVNGVLAQQFNFAIESPNIFYASNAAGTFIYCMGWEDDL